MNLNFRRNILRIIKIKPPPKTGKVNDTKKVGGKIDIMENEIIFSHLWLFHSCKTLSSASAV